MSTWKIDGSHSTVAFSIRHLVIAKVRGRFGAFEGTVELDDAAGVWKSARASIDVASIDTREEKRDAHLRSADFFDAATHPKITFASKSAEARGKDKYVVRGDLSIHGVTKEVSLDVEFLGRTKDPWGGERAAFTATTEIHRTDFGLQWNQALETGGLVVGEKVEIELDVQVVRQP